MGGGGRAPKSLQMVTAAMKLKDAAAKVLHSIWQQDNTLMAESEEELKSLLMKLKEESEKVGLKNSTFRKLRSWHPAPSLHSK